MALIATDGISCKIHEEIGGVKISGSDEQQVELTHISISSTELQLNICR